MHTQDINKVNLEHFLKHSEDSLEDIRKHLITLFEFSEKISGITQNPLYGTYLQTCQKRGLLSNITTTILQQQTQIAHEQALLKASSAQTHKFKMR